MASKPKIGELPELQTFECRHAFLYVFHMLRYLLALACGGFPPDAEAAPGGAPGVAAFSDRVLPLGSPKKRKKSLSGLSTRCVSPCCMLRS